MNKRPRCFVIEATTKDVTLASAYGEIVYLFNRQTGRSSIWSPDFHKELETVFERNEFDSEVDYLVAVGAQVPLLIAVGVLLNQYTSINMLVYYAIEHRYIPLVIGELETHHA